MPCPVMVVVVVVVVITVVVIGSGGKRFTFGNFQVEPRIYNGFKNFFIVQPKLTTVR